MPIQTSLSVVPDLPLSLSSAKNSRKFRKTSTPRIDIPIFKIRITGSEIHEPRDMGRVTRSSCYLRNICFFILYNLLGNILKIIDQRCYIT